MQDGAFNLPILLHLKGQLLAQFAEIPILKSRCSTTSLELHPPTPDSNPLLTLVRRLVRHKSLLPRLPFIFPPYKQRVQTPHPAIGKGYKMDSGYEEFDTEIKIEPATMPARPRHKVKAKSSKPVSTIPLVCSLCPKSPQFSDTSHLLTHIASKSHLANRFKLQIRAQSEPEAKDQLENFDLWYRNNNLDSLLSERMSIKEHKRAAKDRKNKLASSLPVVGGHSVSPLLLN